MSRWVAEEGHHIGDDGLIYKDSEPLWNTYGRVVGEIMVDEVRKFWANDLSKRATIENAGPELEAYYQSFYEDGPDGFSRKVQQIVDILQVSEVWPFPPIEINRPLRVLYNGHHRTTAAIRAGWDKPIPYATSGW